MTLHCKCPALAHYDFLLFQKLSRVLSRYQNIVIGGTSTSKDLESAQIFRLTLQALGAL